MISPCSAPHPYCRTDPGAQSEGKEQGQGEAQSCGWSSGRGDGEDHWWKEGRDESCPQHLDLELTTIANIIWWLWCAGPWPESRFSGPCMAYLVTWGSSLKKEVNAITNLSLELPQSNGLRKTLGEYKTRFEDAIDEFLGFYTWDPWCHEEYVIVPVSIINCPEVERHHHWCQFGWFEGWVGQWGHAAPSWYPNLATHAFHFSNLKSNIIKSGLYIWKHWILPSVQILWHQS